MQSESGRSKARPMALLTCPDCGNEISDAATACPRCGRPTGRAVNVVTNHVVTTRPATSWVTWGCLGCLGVSCLLAGVVFLAGVVGKSASSVNDSIIGKTGGAVASSALLNKIAALTPKDDAARDKLIQEQLNRGTIGDIEYRQGGATMMVGAPFYALDLKDKGALAAAVWISGVRQSKSPAFYGLTLKDRKNGKDVGGYSELGGLEMK